MSSLRKAQEEKQNLEALQTLTRAYGEIASVRMKKAREAVLHSRYYTNEIESIFAQVQAGYAKEIAKLTQKRRLFTDSKGDAITFLSHNGKSVAVFISANTRLYGQLLLDSFNQFAKAVEAGSEATIIGKYGRMLFLSRFPGKPYTFFDMPDHKTTISSLESVVRHVVQYESIDVYFGQFDSLLNQSATHHKITAFAEPGKESSKKYVFEPDLGKILVFFEGQIFASTFEQLIRESQLAKYGARIMAMDKASVNIKKSIEKAAIKELKLKHFVLNKRQLDNLGVRIMQEN